MARQGTKELLRAATINLMSSDGLNADSSQWRSAENGPHARGRRNAAEGHLILRPERANILHAAVPCWKLEAVSMSGWKRWRRRFRPPWAGSDAA
jgi:hypothetical protein